MRDSQARRAVPVHVYTRANLHTTVVECGGSVRQQGRKDLRAAGKGGGLHAGGDVDGVAEEGVLGDPPPHHPRHARAGVQADPDAHGPTAWVGWADGGVGGGGDGGDGEAGHAGCVVGLKARDGESIGAAAVNAATAAATHVI